jgi:RND family efflux transporter MFP subunit
VQLARTNVGYHALKAPISGVVTTAPDNAGVLVGAGTPLFTIEDLSALRLKGGVPETEGWVTEGLAATVSIGPEGDARVVDGRVERVIPSLDSRTKQLPVEVRVDDPPDGVRAHAFVRATVQGADDVAAFAVPRAALVAKPDFSVFVLPAPGALPERVAVRVLDRDGDRVIVRGDLTAGDAVVLDPPHGYGE